MLQPSAAAPVVGPSAHLFPGVPCLPTRAPGDVQGGTGAAAYTKSAQKNPAMHASLSRVPWLV